MKLVDDTNEVCVVATNKVEKHPIDVGIEPQVDIKLKPIKGMELNGLVL